MRFQLALGLCLGMIWGFGWASDGVIEINQDCVANGCFAGDAAGFPITISSGGAYRLTSNISVDTASTGILIATGSQIDLDLGGFTLSGGGSCSDTPALTCVAGPGTAGIGSSGASSIHLHDGTIRGFNGSGVLLFQLQDGSVLEDLLVTENVNAGFAGLSAGAATNGRTIILRRITASRNRSAGILGSSANSPHFVIDDLVASGNGNAGAQLGATATIRNSSFHRNSGLGISSTSTAAISNSSFFTNNGSGTANQFAITTLLNMGGLVCEDATCP